MKKIILGIFMCCAILANAEIIRVEKGFLKGVGIGYAQEISMKNPDFSKDNFINLCLEKADKDENIKSKGNEAITLVVNECVSQLKKIGLLNI